MTDELNKIDGLSMDISAENRAKLRQMFPSVFTETKNAKGELVESVDFEKLKAELGTFTESYENHRERYGMDWPGKKDVLKLIQTKSAATLKPCREESVNFDTTENLFIEGDNLEVLKLLQKSYYGKVKMIYIDPPYNTGKEFIYPDNYSESLDTYLEYAGLTDSTGKRFATNMATEGRFHTKWLNMMYPRLYLAKNLLKNEGYICLSIGDDEVSNLKYVCDEIFGEDNFVTVCSRVMKTGGQKGVFFSPCVDYVLIYAKDITQLNPFREEISQNVIDTVYTKIEKDGPKAGEKYRSMGLYQAMLDIRLNQRYFIECPDGEIVIPPGKTIPTSDVEGSQISPNDGDGVWRWTYSRFKEEKLLGNIEFIRSDNTSLIRSDGRKANWNVYYKIWLKDRLEDGQLPGNILEKFQNRHSSAELKELEILFDFAKPTELIRYLMSIGNVSGEDLVLDFFAGSASTAHAVLKQNKILNGNRKFIMVQLPEKCDEDSEAFKAGYKNIADIGKERIRRVIKKLNEEDEGKLDIEGKPKQDRGFKVLKLDKTNFKQWEQLAPETPQDEILKQMELSMDKVIHTATEEDLIYEIIIKAGLSPTQAIKKLELAGIPVYSLEDGLFMVTLSPTVTQEFFDKVAELKPARFTCLDSAFKGNDTLKANASLTFKARNTGKDNASQIVFEVI